MSTTPTSASPTTPTLRCPHCFAITQHQHLHTLTSDLPTALAHRAHLHRLNTRHRPGSECFSCTACRHRVYASSPSASRFPFVYDRPQQRGVVAFIVPEEEKPRRSRPLTALEKALANAESTARVVQHNGQATKARP